MFAPNPDADMFTVAAGAFSSEDRVRIWQEAESKWKALMQAGLEPEDAWREVVIDFHRNAHWGYPLLSKLDKATFDQPTEEAVRSRTVRRFFWTALQSLVIMKGIIMYFGLNYAIERASAIERESTYGGSDKSFYGWGLGISIAISFGGLIWFAIKNSRARHWD